MPGANAARPRLTRLKYLEAVYEEGETAAWKGAQALYSIHEEQLYKEEGYPTWSDYLHQRWPQSWQRANQLVAWAKVVYDIDKATTTGGIPGDTIPNERQARELSRLPDGETRARVLEEVRAGGGKPTARAIRARVDEVQGLGQRDILKLIEEEEAQDNERYEAMQRQMDAENTIRRFRQGLPSLQRFDPARAELVIEWIAEWQKRFQLKEEERA